MTTQNSVKDATPVPLARLRRGVRHSHNWWQLVRFVAVGASGYVVNLVVFAAALHGLGAGYRTAAVAAFLVAVVNNFIWNRRYTFSGSGGRIHHQAVRFLAISGLNFLVALGLLMVFVGLGVPPLAAQAISIACATPLNFIANKIWTFTAPA